MKNLTNSTNSQIKTKAKSLMDDLLTKSESKAIPKIGDLVEGTVISVSKNEVNLDIEGLTTGIVRGKEIYDESDQFSNVNIGDKVSATVLEIENENGQMELSFRYAGHQKAWNSLDELLKSQEPIEAKITDANKGGLMVKVGNVMGFLPVSQLTTEHYPRIDGGDKSKILVALKKYINQNFKVKVMDVNEAEEKLIVSEKTAWEEKQNKSLSKYKIGDVVEGKITGIVNFGAFIEFDDGLEGLIHISELAWQRIDNPRQIVKVGQKVKAEIISVDNARVSLSLKKLIEDPWKDIENKYKIGQKVNGKIIKFNPFGAFVELSKDIHGLLHISEISDSTKEKIKENEEHNFYIMSINPNEHRLGLSLNKPSEKKDEEKKEDMSEDQNKKEDIKEEKADEKPEDKDEKNK